MYLLLFQMSFISLACLFFKDHFFPPAFLAYKTKYLIIYFLSISIQSLKIQTFLRFYFLSAQGALFDSNHADDNDIRSINYQCHVITFDDYKALRERHDKEHLQNEDESFTSEEPESDYDVRNCYFKAGYYDSVNQEIIVEPGYEKMEDLKTSD